MKSINRSFLLLVCFSLLLIVLQHAPIVSNAQPQPFGPNVTSGVLRFNEVATAAGENEIIAAKADTKYRILYMIVKSQSDTSVNFYLKSGATTLYANAAHPDTIQQTGFEGPVGIFFTPYDQGIFETESSKSLSINLSTAQEVLCVGAYVEIQ